MSAPWLTSVTPVGPPTSANPTVRQLLYAGVVTGAWSGIVSLILYGIGRLFGVPFAVTSGTTTSTVTWWLVLFEPLVIALVAALLSALMRGRRHAGRIVYVVGTVIAIVSLVGPLIQGIDWPTKILLALMHVVTWFLVVPQIARIVKDSEPGRSVERVDE